MELRLRLRTFRLDLQIKKCMLGTNWTEYTWLAKIDIQSVEIKIGQALR